MKRIMIAGWELKKGEYDDYIHAVEELGVGKMRGKDGVKAFLSLDPAALQDADGLILPGSRQDMNPRLWGEEDQCSNDINDELDRLQWELLEQAEAAGKPVLGVCRGMQFINVYFGGTLIQDLVCSPAHKSSKPERYHPVVNEPGSFMEALLGPAVEVNSRHHQGLGRIGDGLRVVSRWQAGNGLERSTADIDAGGGHGAAVNDAAGDGSEKRTQWEESVAEAITHVSLPIIGFQWHPEKMCLYGNEKQQANGAAMLRYFLEMTGR